MFCIISFYYCFTSFGFSWHRLLRRTLVRPGFHGINVEPLRGSENSDSFNSYQHFAPTGHANICFNRYCLILNSFSITGF